MFRGMNVHQSASWKYNFKKKKPNQPFSLTLARSSTRDPFPENEIRHKITHGMGGTPFMSFSWVRANPS